MKVEDFIRQKERAEFERVPAKHLIKPLFLMSTYERVGLLSKTIKSFLKYDKSVVHIIDDGSEMEGKTAELDYVESLGMNIHRLKHRGIAGMWQYAINFAREQTGYDCVVIMEDDILFSSAWLDVLASLMGNNLGMASCFRFHTDIPTTEIVNRIEVLRVKRCSFQATLVPMDVIRQSLEDAVLISERDKVGFDVGLSEMIAKSGREMFVTARSYVSHVGYNNSIAGKHGYKYLPIRGVNLIYELEKVI